MLSILTLDDGTLEVVWWRTPTDLIERWNRNLKQVSNGRDNASDVFRRSDRQCKGHWHLRNKHTACQVLHLKRFEKHLTWNDGKKVTDIGEISTPCEVLNYKRLEKHLARNWVFHSGFIYTVARLASCVKRQRKGHWHRWNRHAASGFTPQQARKAHYLKLRAWQWLYLYCGKIGTINLMGDVIIIKRNDIYLI